MGDTLSNSCCAHNDDHRVARQLMLPNTSAYDLLLQDFAKENPNIKQVLAHKWSYTSNIDKNIITRTGEDTIVGSFEPNKSSEVIILYSDGFLYEGTILNSQRQGCGRLISRDGDCYQGKWHNNEPEGEGVFQGAQPKRKYSGIWANGYLQGKGKATYEDGSHYVGQFYNNMRHGKGKIVYPDGVTYEGAFKNDAIEGFGTLIGISHKYEGSWRDGKMDGAGKSSWYNEADELLDTYDGQYEGGFKHGKGEYRWSNTRVYKGEWQQGQIKQKDKH